MTRDIKAAIRLKRLMSPLDISNADRHGKRLGKIAHVDPSRSALNRHWEYRAGQLEQVSTAPDLAPALERRREDREAVRRANTPTLATEIMFITSRAAFENGTGQIDSERAYAWADQMLAAFEERFPGMTAAARLDLDERSPHLSIFAVPIYMKEANKPRADKADKSEDARARRKPRAPKPTVSHKQVFGGIEEMRELQRWVQGLNADFLAPFGLEVTASTPRTESGANHIHPDDFRRVMKDVERLENEARDAARKLLTDAQDKQQEIARDAALKAEEAADAILTAARLAAETIRDTAKAEAEAERDAARAAAKEARQAAENAATEAKALLNVVKVAQPLAPLHDAYQALLDGSNLTPQQAVAAQEAADQDCRLLETADFRAGIFPEDRDAAVWFSHPEVQTEIRTETSDRRVLDLMEPASGSIRFRARYIKAFGFVRDLVMKAVEKVIERRKRALLNTARERMKGEDWLASAKLGEQLTHDNWGDLRERMGIDETECNRHIADYNEHRVARATVNNSEYRHSAAEKEVLAEARHHARAASIVAARLERGPRQVAQWLSIPADLRQTFTAALDAAAALETALARRTMTAEALGRPVAAQEPLPGGRTPENPSSLL